MSSLGMKGPFALDKGLIDCIVPDNVIGNYALGYVRNNIFFVKYIGRSDTDLKKRICDHIGEKDYYTHFKFIEQSSVKEAYILECKNFHEFHGLEGELDNKVHPAKPEGIEAKCPYDVIDYYFGLPRNK